MKASFVDLRKKSSEIIQALKRNERVTLFYRGKPAAIMQPVCGESGKATGSARDHAAFGLWKDRHDLNDVPGHVRELRKRRFSDL
jgi:antitoxin (DNA-binding transcriptional repressor) of toxin-antitoxin stability system